MKSILRKNLNRGLRRRRSRAKFFGTADMPRLTVFRSNRYMSAQLIDDASRRTLASATSMGLKGKLSKIDAAKEVGKIIGEAAKKMGVKKAVFHRGHYKYHGRVKAVADSARAAGLKI